MREDSFFEPFPLLKGLKPLRNFHFTLALALLQRKMHQKRNKVGSQTFMLREERGDAERALALDQKVRELNSQNGSPNNQSPVLNLSKSGGGSHGDASGSEGGHSGPDDEEEDDNLTDVEEEDEKDQGKSTGKLSDVERPELPTSGSPRSECQALNYSALASAAGSVTPSAPDSNLNSTETLLRNIQGLLKVAADNARQQERQINYEKGVNSPSSEIRLDFNSNPTH
ncbi:hypothetical protein RUM44_011856 [Polyplax serrata]|uniref:Dachshund n=1 Tax=Polyplax serrata TaxID=468196 RepID=A0ABR1B9P8_POLSC